MDASGDANDWEKQIEQMKKDMEEWKAKEAHVPKPNPEPKPHTELPQEDKDRIEEATTDAAGSAGFADVAEKKEA
ncbi:hypothetical protein XANCAGTX0491_008060 [Xanthoria calcicola]